MLRPCMGDTPTDYQDARAFHIGVHPERPDWPLLEELGARTRACGGLLSVEPFTHALGIVGRTDVERLLAAGDIFSPNEKEAASIVGPGGAEELVERMVEAGAKIVCLRRGGDGCMVYDAKTREGWVVPAVAGAAVVDVTGCGNSFCGAFAAAVQRGRGLREAGAWGCVAGSLMMGEVGVPLAGMEELREVAASRVQQLLEQARPLAISL
mmetsp:Transcript_46262/g.148088  ORF Transcript_46262/g.148088 Transcript_46262/m.148088 type:complete len:210 (+) Transcript_46262:185-814(+)